MHTTPIPVPRPAAAPWYAQRWPWLLMLGPATVLVGGGFATWLALSHPDAMVVDDYYKQGKAINQDLRRDRAASSLHLRLRARYLPGPGRLQGRIDSAGYPVLTPFTIHLVHPTLPERDIVLPVQPGADGYFSVALPALDKTHWQVVVEGGKHDWRLARSWDSGRQPELVIAALST
jgi:hypothetical protein